MSVVSFPFQNRDLPLAWCVQSLGQHRLWPVARLLAARGLIDSELASACQALASADRRRMERATQRESEVLAAVQPLPVLLLKGALVARTEYPEAWMRYREDCDLLVAKDALGEVVERLRRLGYRPPERPEGSTPMRQRVLVCDLGAGQRHVLDLHWDLSNHPAFYARAPFDDLLSRSRALPGEPSAARGLGRADALLHAVIHYYGNERRRFRPVQWLLDVDLMWSAASEEERAQALRLARQMEISGLLAALLEQATRALGTTVLAQHLAALGQAGCREWRSKLAAEAGSAWAEHWLAVSSLKSARARLAYLRALFFPSPDYMRWRYPEGHWMGLPGLYLRRALGLRARRPG